MTYAVLFLAFHLVLFTGCTSGQNIRDKEKQVKDQILGKPYDGTILPRPENGSLKVEVSLVLTNKIAINDDLKTMQQQLVLKLEWNEPRFTYTTFPPNSGPYHVTISPSLLDKVWIPDIYFADAEEVEFGEKSMKVYPNGDVKYTAVTKVTSFCNVDLSNFPHDTQTCGLKISSFAFPSADLQFEWRKEKPVEIRSGFIPGFVLEQFITSDECFYVAESSADTSSCLMLSLTIKRQFNSYLILVYIPCTMLIIISWLTYFLHPVKSATPRLVTSIGALGLAVIGTVGQNSTLLPRVPYTKSIDVWTGTSLTIIFLSLVEFVVVNYLNHYCGTSGKPSERNHQTQSGDTNCETVEQQTPLNPRGDEKFASQIIQALEESKLGAVVDIIFRIAVPILFLVFIILYWLLLV